MSEVLDQSEIDALLGAVATQNAGVAVPAPPSAPVSGAPTGRSQLGLGIEAAVYDFKRPERVSKDQIRALASIHEVFARNFGATLSGFLRTIIDLRVVGVEQLTYNEFIHSLPNPTCFMVLQAPPLEGQMCLEVSPLIVYPILDRLLGGDSESLYIPQRPLTSIEWRLMGRLVEKALEHLSEVWRNLVDARFEVLETESNPQLVHIVAPTEVVVFITFEIKLGQNAGTMSLCIPFNVIESVLSHLTSQSWFYKPKAASDLHRQRLVRNVSKSLVRFVTYLGQTTIKLRELRELQVGDLIQLDKRANQELILQVAGRNKFAGVPGRVRGRRALRITRPADADEAI
ncbi:MAG: flagellar motor switch protein FliM [Phycisphaerae bacterium]